MSLRPVVLLPLACVVAFLLGGCDDEKPITHEEISEIVADHLPPPDSVAESDTFRGLPRGAVQLDMAYDADDDNGSARLYVAVGPGALPLKCEYLTCAQIETDVPDATLTLAWGLMEPEEDPGSVYLVLQREDKQGVTVVIENGPSVTGDPRQMTLPVTVDEMVDLVEDDGLRYDGG